MILISIKKNWRCKWKKYRNLKTRIIQTLLKIKLAIQVKMQIKSYICKNRNYQAIIFYKILMNKIIYKNNKIRRCFHIFSLKLIIKMEQLI